MIEHAITAIDQGLVCPDCRASVNPAPDDGLHCEGCGRDFPSVAGLPDLRLVSDRYLSLAAERAKAERLYEIEPNADLATLAVAYYDLTEDVVDRRRARFLRHIAGAVARGEALASRLPADGAILELGCGTGGLLVAANALGRSITGVDLASRWLVVARRRLTDHGRRLSLVVGEAERLPWPSASFDTVVADSLLEHVDDPAAVLREARRVLRPGGALVLWSPNRFSMANDPHLGLWGIGWLPRRWLAPYLRLRGKTEWPPRTLSTAEAARLASRAGFEHVVVGAPGITDVWIRSRPLREQHLLRLYEFLRRVPLGRGLLRWFGPLWELKAVAGADG
jgi:ubiquinone/menaquinone biosynthesis C-methylase UbiE